MLIKIREVQLKDSQITPAESENSMDAHEDFLNSLKINKKDQSAITVGLGRLIARPSTKYHRRVNLASIFGTKQTQTGHTQVV